MEYPITACPPFRGLGLCNQLCLVLNALEQAFQVVSEGAGVVVKPHIQSASYGGKTIHHFPPSGYQWVNHATLLGNDDDPQPNTVKYLEIEWNHESKHASRFREGTILHWLDLPASVCVYVDRFMTHYQHEDHCVPYTDILDLPAMNRSLSPWGVRLECRPSDQSPNSIYFLKGGFTPRKSLLFRKLIPQLRFHPSIQEKARAWLGDRTVHQVLHLRNEPDAIDHWSAVAGLDRPLFQERLHAVYQQTIRGHFHKDRFTLVLTAHKENNPVVQWMEQEGYWVDKYWDKELSAERDLAAVYDLVLATHCQELFLGACQPETLGGSTFSFFLSHLLPDTVQKIMVDMDGIKK